MIFEPDKMRSWTYFEPHSCWNDISISASVYDAILLLLKKDRKLVNITSLFQISILLSLTLIDWQSQWSLSYVNQSANQTLFFAKNCGNQFSLHYDYIFRKRTIHWVNSSFTVMQKMSVSPKENKIFAAHSCCKFAATLKQIFAHACCT